MITILFLADWALRSSILILSGLVLLYALRVKDPSVRLAAWTVMLCGSLAIPALNTTLPRVPFAPPFAMLQPSVAPAGFPAPGDKALPGSHRALSSTHLAGKRQNAGISQNSILSRVLLAIYVLIATALLLRLFAGLAMSLRLLRTSRASGQTTEGIEIRESDQVVSPVALGIAPSSIVLPADWRQWSSGKLDAVLAHERSHIRRHDPAVQLLSNIHRALLWFSPLSWLMHSRIVRLAEEVSDDAAIAVTSDRASYAEILLDFMQHGVRTATWQGVPMARYSRPEQRIHRILDATTLSHGVTRWGIAVILSLASPLAYVAALAAPQSSPPASLSDAMVKDVQTLVREGQGDVALEFLDKRLQANPNDGALLLAKAQVLIRMGRYDEALDLVEKHLEARPNSATLLLIKAAALLHLDREGESRAVLEKLLEEKPANADAWLELGVLDLTGKRFQEAEEAFRKAYAIDPSNPRGLLGISSIYFERKDPEKAVQVIADAARAEPQRTDLKKELANAEFRAKQFDQAIVDYESILDRYKDSPIEQADIYNRIGMVYSAVHKYEEAIENLQKAVRLAPLSVAYVSQLAQLYDNTGRQQEALTTFRAALKLDPNNGVVLNNLAYDVAQYGGNLDEAIAFAKHARQQLPKAVETLDTIGWIYIKQNQNADAIEVFRDLIGRVPDNPVFLYHYAVALAQSGDKADALQQLNAALRNHPDQNEEKEIKDLIRSISF